MAEAWDWATLPLAGLLVSGCTLPARPVLYGQGAEFDGCGATGEARIVGDQRLDLRAAPSARATVIYRISPGEGFWLCDGADGWTGVVVHEGYDGNAGQGPSDDCGAAFIVVMRQPYRGPCLSGWVPSDEVLLIAG